MVRKIILLLVVILLSFVNRDANAQLKKIYIANDDHTDYMWTLNEADYKTAFLAMLDSWIAKNTNSYGNGPSSPTALDTMSKWNTDGSFWIWTYEKKQVCRTI